MPCKHLVSDKPIWRTYKVQNYLTSPSAHKVGKNVSWEGPKGFIALMFEGHLQYGDSTTKWPFYVSSKFHSIYNLFSLVLQVLRFSSMIKNGTIQSLYSYTVQCSTVT